MSLRIVSEEPQKQQQEMDPTHVALAYQNTRKELAVMCSLCHPHIIPFYGVCLYPLCFVLQLAAGELGHKLMQYHEVGQTLSFSAAWASALQVIKFDFEAIFEFLSSTFFINLFVIVILVYLTVNRSSPNF